MQRASLEAEDVVDVETGANLEKDVNQAVVVKLHLGLLTVNEGAQPVDCVDVFIVLRPQRIGVRVHIRESHKGELDCLDEASLPFGGKPDVFDEYRDPVLDFDPDGLGDVAARQPSVVQERLGRIPVLPLHVVVLV